MQQTAYLMAGSNKHSGFVSFMVAAQAEGEAKHLKQNLDRSATEFVCPITHELPLDPVTAEDGRVYKRKAIEEWLLRGRGTLLSCLILWDGSCPSFCLNEHAYPCKASWKRGSKSINLP